MSDTHAPTPSTTIAPATAEEYERIRSELPELDLLTDPDVRAKVATVWASFLRETTYASIADCPPFPPVDCDLASHTRHVVRNCVAMAANLAEFGGVRVDEEVLLAAALTHDASKLVEQHGPNGEQTALGRALLHGQVTGVRCLELGLPPDVAYIVTYHPFTPPHVHVKPRCVEFVILSWADIGAADPLFWLNGLPTHLDIGRRFFTLD
jgi:HD domain